MPSQYCFAHRDPRCRAIKSNFCHGEDFGTFVQGGKFTTMNTTLLLIAEIGFSVLTIIFMVLLIRLIKSGIDATSWDHLKKKRVLRNIVIALISWSAAISYWSLSGIMGNFSIFPLNFLPVIALPLITIFVLIIRSKNLSDILKHTSPAAVARLQVFRFFVEILLWVLFVANVLPAQMTFEGMNFDVLSGITGPIVAVLIARNKISSVGVIIWNVLCLVLLANIVTIAILSTPSPIQVFMNEPVNTIVTKFPTVFLPGFLVPLAYTLSFFSIKQMTMRASIKIQNV